MTAAMAALAPPAQKPKAGRREPLQKKMMVGAANDRMEQEADRVASRMTSPAPIMAATPPPTISRMVVQRAAAPVKSGPEDKDKPLAAPEERAVRKAKPDEKPKPATAPKAQRKAKPEEKAKSAVKPPVQRKTKPEKPPEERGVAQRREASGAKAAPPAKVEAPATPIGHEGGAAPAAVENRIERMRKGTAPGLEPELKGKVEGAVGADLSDVKVHDDRAAAETARDLGARAFTVGQDMFFGQGEYRPGTTEGQKLIAHEAAHTVQQKGGSAAARKIQRNGKKGSGSSKTKTKDKLPPVTETVDTLSGENWSLNAKSAVKKASGELCVPELKLPKVKGMVKGGANPDVGQELTITLPVAGNTPFTVAPQPVREERELEWASVVWTKGMRERDTGKIKEKIVGLTKKDKVGRMEGDGGKEIFVLRRTVKDKSGDEVFLNGTLDSLAKHDAILRPMLAPKSGVYCNMQADHLLEDQLGGPNVLENYWLLEGAANSAIGNQIKDNVNEQIDATLKKAREEKVAQREQGVDFGGSVPRDVQSVKRNYALTFNTVVEGRSKKAVDNHWTKQDVLDAKHMKFFKALTEKELFDEGFKFKEGRQPNRINVFPSPEGGLAYPFKVNKQKKELDLPYKFYRGMKVSAVKYYADWTENPGSKICDLQVQYRRKEDRDDPKSRMLQAVATLPVNHDRRLGFGGYLSRQAIVQGFREKGAKFRPLCPVDFKDAGITPEGEFYATCSAASELALFPQLDVPINIKGDEISVDFAVPVDKLSLGPVSLVDPAISLGVDGKGFFVRGSTGVVVEDVGRGDLYAKGYNDDVVIGGKFAFDFDFLQPADVSMEYSFAKDDLKAKVELGLVKGTLPGVKGAKVQVDVTRNTFGFAGVIDLAGPLEGSQILVDYTPEAGLKIEGRDLPLPLEKLPGVTDAKITVIVRRDSETGDWKLGGGGKASFEKGGAKGSLGITLDGEMFDFTGRVDLAKGPATGWIEINATNRLVDPEGAPTEPKKEEKGKKKGAQTGPFQIWGKGEATVLFGKYLKGTVGIEYTREGKVILAGEVAMAQAYNIFDRKDLSPKKPLFDKETPDFPIWGIKLGPVGIGIFAFGYATLKGVAWVGPGQIKDAHLGVKDLDLDHPELATVTGGAKFAVEAYGGISASIGGGLKAQVANAYAKGKIGLYGDLGLLLAGSFDVVVNWNQADGFAIGADAKLSASPKFEFGIEASLTVGVDLWLTEIEETWGPWRHPLGKFGPDIPFSMTYPIKWSEKDGLQLDVDDIEPPKPEISAKDMMKDSFDTLV